LFGSLALFVLILAEQTCGDSQCEQTYSFIGRGTGKGRKGQKITYAEAWEGFRKSLSSARIPCTAVKRYPVRPNWNHIHVDECPVFCCDF
jgi:alanyl-tRNA synthetase